MNPTLKTSVSKALSQAHAWIGLTLCMLLSPTLATADTLTVAVASNFAETLEQLATEFERDSPHRLRLVRGSSGRHFAQIVNGAPFDLFFSADAERPRRLLSELGYSADRLYSYATGRLVLWGSELESAASAPQMLHSGAFDSIAIANPRLAPYGQAALESLEAMDLKRLLDERPGKVVRGENVAQAYQFVTSGNADLGFVALSQVLHAGASNYWIVPENYYQPILQQLLVLRESDASKELIRWLASDKARLIIEQAGYGLPDRI